MSKIEDDFLRSTDKPNLLCPGNYPKERSECRSGNGRPLPPSSEFFYGPLYQLLPPYFGFRLEYCERVAVFICSLNPHFICRVEPIPREIPDSIFD